MKRYLNVYKHKARIDTIDTGVCHETLSAAASQRFGDGELLGRLELEVNEETGHLSVSQVALSTTDEDLAEIEAEPDPVVPSQAQPKDTQGTVILGDPKHAYHPWERTVHYHWWKPVHTPEMGGDQGPATDQEYIGSAMIHLTQAITLDAVAERIKAD